MSSFRRGILLLAVWSSNLVFGCGESLERPLRTRGIPIIGGTRDDNPAHGAVVGLNIRVSQFERALCSGTLIGRRVVLTAAHCADVPDPDAYKVLFGDNIYQGENRGVSAVLPHPDYDPVTFANDIALLRLSGDPPGFAAPIPFLPRRLGITIGDEGRSLGQVGFGKTSVLGGDGYKMTFTNALDWLCTTAGGCEFQSADGWFKAAENTLCYDQGEGGTCSGDSGGPSLIDRDGKEYVAGVASYADLDCGVFGCATKVDEFEVFILAFSGAPAGSVCEGDDGCISGFCRGKVCCESECNDLCSACNLPGQEGRCRPIPDESPCQDNDLCNGAEVCRSGECRSGTPLVCQDAIPCTNDRCEGRRGCVFEPIAVSCYDDNPCTQDLCDPDRGCLHEPEPDGWECGPGMICLSGDCLREPKPAKGCGCASGATNPFDFGLLLGLWLWILLRRPHVDQPELD